MAQTGINIELKDTTLSRRQPSVGNAALVYGIKVSSGSVSGKPTLITSLDSYTAWAASDAPDAKLLNNDPHLLGMVTQFYAKAGSGTYLWLILTSGEKGDFVTTNAANIKRQIRLTLEANYDNRPRIIGWCSQANDDASGWVPTTTPTVVKAIETIQNAMFAEGIRFVNVYTSNVNGVQATSASNIINLSTYATPSVAYMPTTTLYNTTVDKQGNITAYTPIKDVGEAIGILSAISVAESIGSHERAAVAQKAFFNDPETVVSITEVDPSIIDALGKGQYLFHRPYPTGIFYNDGATCNDPTKALSRLEFVRLGNAVCDDAQEFFSQILNTQAPVDAKGDLSRTYATQIENNFYNLYCQPRISQRQCSGIRVTVAAQDNNFVSTRTILVSIEILPSLNVDWVKVGVLYVSALS